MTKNLKKTLVPLVFCAALGLGVFSGSVAFAQPDTKTTGKKAHKVEEVIPPKKKKVAKITPKADTSKKKALTKKGNT